MVAQCFSTLAPVTGTITKVNQRRAGGPLVAKLACQLQAACKRRMRCSALALITCNCSDAKADKRNIGLTIILFIEREAFMIELDCPLVVIHLVIKVPKVMQHARNTNGVAKR